MQQKMSEISIPYQSLIHCCCRPEVCHCNMPAGLSYSAVEVIRQQQTAMFYVYLFRCVHKTELSYICLPFHFLASLSTEQPGITVLSCCSAAWCLCIASMFQCFLSSLCFAAWARASLWWRVLLSSCNRGAVTRARKHILTTNMQVRTTRHPKMHIILTP